MSTLAARLAALGACAVVPIAAHGAEIAEVLQGTNLTFALAPNHATLVVGLVDQLWRLPASGGGAEALTPADETSRNPRFSPDGTTVVYQRFSEGQWDIWLLDLGTGEQRALTATPHDEREPEFAADGRSVVFVSNRTGHFCLWSLDLATGVETQLTEESGDASFPTASELGPIAYLLEHGAQFEVRVLLQNGVTAPLAARNEPIGPPSWRPGGGVLVFSVRDSANGSRLRMLVLGDEVVEKPLSDAEDVFRARAAWLSSSEFLYAADGQLWRRALGAQSRQPVHVFAARAVEARPPPTDLPPLDDPTPQIARGIAGLTVAADGRKVAFTALGDLWLSERGVLRRLTDDAAVELDPTFTPDSESVVFSSERSGQFELWRIGLRGGAPSQLTFGAVQPRHAAVSGDGKRVAFIETDGIGVDSMQRLSVADLTRPGRVATVASGLTDARPSWGADGRTLGARVLAAPTSPAGLPVELGIEPPRNRSGAARTTRGAPPAEIELKWAPASAGEDYVVQVGRLFDGVRGEYRRHVDIHVSGGRITAIVGRDLLPAPPKVIDARDATVIPGLVDVHAHASSLVGERLGRTWLAYGVTTVREVSADVEEAVERGEAWASGRPLGPRLIVSPADGSTTTAAPSASALVPIRAYPGIADGFGHELARLAHEAPGRAFDARLARRGLLDVGSGPHYELELSPELASYQDTIGTLIASSTVLPSSLGAVAGLRGWAESAQGPARRDPAYAALFSPAERASWSSAGPAADALPRLEQTVSRLVRAGGRVAIGTDAPAVPYGLGVHYELELLAAAGLPNDQALRLASAGGALALGLEGQIGTLEDGKIADFVVIDGDPLVRLADTLRVTAVVRGGVWIDRATLLTSSR
ncbi:MAG TPA: amidohydrolase family protein [Gammaproteobacteria bacterium]|nr:amidohydrolase family protein [Gammaproteobacteria bacterium]